MAGANGGNWRVTCQCGWRTQGSKNDVVAAVQEHGRRAHNVELSEAQVMAQAVPFRNWLRRISPDYRSASWS